MKVLPTRSTWHKVWGKTATVIVVLSVAFALSAGAWAVDNSYVTRQLAQENKTLALLNLRSQNNHHASTIRKDAQLQQALNELKSAAGVIQYEGAVLAYQNGEIIAAQQQGHATLAVMQALQQEINADVPALSGALKLGQAQINAYLNYLTCLTLNPTNAATCGAAPPLPPT